MSQIVIEILVELLLILGAGTILFVAAWLSSPTAAAAHPSARSKMDRK